MAAYCTQSDIEARIPRARLAELTNDIANSDAPDSGVLSALVSRAQTIIDGKAGQVYTVPFTAVPDVIKEIAIDIVCFYCFQRRITNIEMPKSVEASYADALSRLEAVSNMLLKLPTSATIASAEADVVATPPLVDFNSTDSTMSFF